MTNADHAGGAAFAELLANLQEVQDLVRSTNPPHAVLAQAASRLHETAALLRPHVADETEAIAGKRPDLPGRGNPLLLPLVIEEATRDSVRGRVRFTPYYRGGFDAAHGGTITLLFDEVLGRLANMRDEVARTAYLHVNYRKISPIGSELRVEAAVDREEGRKRFLSGRLFDADGTLLADAEGLFVTLLPGQP
jgi:acyl-coenzyme A thioesterase PaaI-like protein